MLVNQSLHMEPDDQAALLHLIESRFGLHLMSQQVSGLAAIIAGILPQTPCTSPAELCAALAGGQLPSVLDVLAERLTVGESHFFRVEHQIEALRQLVLPDLLRRRAATRRLRLWSAGCSTGEEPYTLAIVLRELLPLLDAWQIDVLATDINGSALDAAQRACYGEWSFRGMSAEMRDRYFVPTGKQWSLAEPVRRMVRFARLNLADDFFTLPGWQEPDVDLILCRNVTIYFSADATRQLYRRFAKALSPDGWLILGPSDPMPVDLPLRAVTASGSLLWQRAPDVMPLLPISASGSGGDRAAASAAALLPDLPPPPVRALSAGKPPTPPVHHSGVNGAAAVALIWSMVDNGARDAAREQASVLTRTWPLEAAGHLLLGMIYLDDGLLDHALESLRRATFLDRDGALAHFSLGRAYLRQGQVGRARAAFVHVRRLVAALPDAQAVQDSNGLVAGDLRRAVDAQIASLHGDARAAT